jgi:hypothetical protein
MIKDEISITGRVQMHDDTPPTPARGDEPTAPSRGAMPSMWRRLAASLVYDGRHASPAPGVRAVGAGFPRLIYRARGFEIDLQIRPDAKTGRFRLLGQILDDAFEPCPGRVVLQAAHGRVEEPLDDCGHFSLAGLVAGGYRLEVRLPDATIEIPPVCL